MKRVFYVFFNLKYQHENKDFVFVENFYMYRYIDDYTFKFTKKCVSIIGAKLFLLYTCPITYLIVIIYLCRSE